MLKPSVQQICESMVCWPFDINVMKFYPAMRIAPVSLCVASHMVQKYGLFLELSERSVVWRVYLLAGIIWIKQGISWRPTELLAQHASVSSASDGARYVIVLTSPFDVIREFKTCPSKIQTNKQTSHQIHNFFVHMKLL